MRKTSGPLKHVGKRYPSGNLAKSSLRQCLVQLSVAVMPQDGHLDPSRTMEVSRPKQAHTQHFTLERSSVSASFTNFLGKIRLPIVLLGDPGGVKLTESGGKAPLSVASHWCSGVISASQFKHLDFSGGTGPGVKTRGAGAGEGRLFVQGEIGKGEFSGQGELLSSSFSGDSTSLSPI